MTLLFFADESADRQYHYHVGLLATGEQVAAAERDLELVAQRALDLGYNEGWPPQPELHATDIFGGRCGWGVLDYDERFQIVEAALDVMVEHGIELMARGVELTRFRNRYGTSQTFLHEIAFRNLLERLCERLKQRAELGLVITDEHYTKSVVREEVRRAKAGKTPGYRGTNFAPILDTVHFVDSRDSRLVQLADLVAYTRRRRRSIPTEKHHAAEAAMSRIADRLGSAVPHPVGQFDSVYWAQV
jgi:AcrR family transcriptional regulator